jgi:hypothetical protein
VIIDNVDLRIESRQRCQAERMEQSIRDHDRTLAASFLARYLSVVSCCPLPELPFIKVAFTDLGNIVSHGDRQKHRTKGKRRQYDGSCSENAARNDESS